MLLAGGYVGYVFLAYHRLPDNQTLAVTQESSRTAETGIEYSVVSWNIGFGAYEEDYGFFMDGGTQFWAWSPERLQTNLQAIGQLLSEQNADFLLIQEVDTDATRSYHTDEYGLLQSILTKSGAYSRAFAQNYDSPFLLYPLTQPHGASRSGIGTFSVCGIASAVRRSLPIETGLTKLLDLDRCCSVCRIPVAGGGELVLYNLHLSAYTSDGAIATEQLKMLLADMQSEYEAGNWCVAGGDFNKDLLGNSADWFGAADREYTWGQPIPPETFEGTDRITRGSMC